MSFMILCGSASTIWNNRESLFSRRQALVGLNIALFTTITIGLSGGQLRELKVDCSVVSSSHTAVATLCRGDYSFPAPMGAKVN